MSTLKTSNIQVGQSTSATNNFTVSTDANGGLILARGNQGATTQNIVTVASNGIVNFPVGSTVQGVSAQRLELRAPVLASNRTVDFTFIPDWAKRITVLFASISTNSTFPVIVQLGDSSGVKTTGYLGSYSFVSSGGGNEAAVLSSGFGLSFNSGAADIRHGTMTLVSLGTDGVSWVASATSALSNGASVGSGAGSVALTTRLTTVRVTTTGTTDAFDSGSLSILIEG